MSVVLPAAVFKLNRQGFNLRRGVSFLSVMLLPLIVLAALGEGKYFVSVALAALFTGLCDPGGKYSYRAPRLALVAITGTLLTALGYWLGAQAWGWVVAAAFVVTLLAGLAVKYGAHRFTAALLLNIWFLIALSLPDAYQADHVQTGAWPQALAWLIGSVLMIGYIGGMWLVTGRTGRQQTGAELLPGDTTPVPLTRTVIMYAGVRAIAVAVAVGIAFGFDVANADWMPVAALVAMKPSLEQSMLTAVQRLTGTVIGAVVASAVLLGVDGKLALGAIVDFGRVRGGNPRGELYLVRRGGGSDGADRGGTTASDRPFGGGAQGSFHLCWRRGRRPRHVSGHCAGQAHTHFRPAACDTRRADRGWVAAKVEITYIPTRLTEALRAREWLWSPCTPYPLTGRSRSVPCVIPAGGIW